MSMCRWVPRLAALVVAVALASACGGGGGGESPDGRLAFTESSVTATVANGVATVEVQLASTTGGVVSGSVDVRLRSVDGEELDRGWSAFAVNEPETVSLALEGLPADATVADLGAYVLDYDVRTDQGRSYGRRSLFRALHQVELQVLSADRYARGDQGFVRAFVRDPANGLPITDAQVKVDLELPDGSRRTVATARTDEFGAVGAKLALPEGVTGDAKLVVACTTEDSEENAEADVAIVDDARILLTTDKPLYQPGQTIHLRALALERGTKLPYAGGEVIFTVEDAAGNKVFKEAQVADAYGIAATTFRLATQVNMGQFRLSAALGDSEAEKQVTVERYVLPKYKIEVTLDKAYYEPGDTVHGTVSAQYFFGQPVAGGQVAISAKTYDIGFSEFAALTTTTNEDGLATFEFTMPMYVVGQPLAQGNGLVSVDVTVTDNADHEQTISRATVVAQAAIEATLVPESGELVLGVENHVWVVLNDPMGGPVSAAVEVEANGATDAVTIDEQGLGVWTVTPETLPLEARVTVTPAEGDPIVQDVSLAGGGIGKTILLRTDGALYASGDAITVTVLLPQPRARVFLDVVHGGRTVATAAVTAEGGVATWAVQTDATMEGALQLSAYFLGAQSEIVRDERLVYVQPADELHVRLVPDKDVYLPGDAARIDIEVSDAAGAPKAAALGVQVVDEAVFALQEAQPGLLKVFFELEDALATPKFQFAWPDLSPTSVIETPDPVSGGGGDTVEADRSRRAEVAFAAQAGGTGLFGVDVNTQTKRVAALKAVLQPLVDADVARLVETLQDLVSDDVAEYECLYDDVSTYVAQLSGEKDFWEQPYLIEPADEWGETWNVTSSGPDETPDTADDVKSSFSKWAFSCGKNGGGWFPGGDGGWDMADGGPQAGGMGGGGMPTGDRADDQAPPPADPTASGDDGAASGPRVRRWFPETLFVDPAVITDGNGQAHIDLTIADSITAWRMTALANAADGALGSATAGMTVFQDFFVDIDFPATLTRGDTVSVPVAVYNYLDVPQTVTLEAEDADWLTFVNGSTVTIPLDPGQVDAVYFEVQVAKVGPRALTVVARGSAMSDAIERTVLVEPDGKEFIDTASARFHTTGPADQVVTEEIAKTVPIPEASVDGSGVLLVKVYPGFFSQAVEGLDSMLRLPDG